MVYTLSDKRAPHGGALFVLLVLLACLALWGPVVAAPDGGCGPQRIDIRARLDRIYDGDTLRLADGRKVRLIGVNTPERARKEHMAEPLADAATRYVEQLLNRSPRLRLQLGTEQRDRYGRLLAHVFLADDRNLSRILLEQGFGLAIMVPPNAGFADCYARAEQQARQARRGVWQHPYFEPLSPQQVAAGNITGFRRVHGRIVRIGKSRKSLWLNLSDKFALRIARTDLARFDSLPLHALQGKQVTARGWIRAYNGRWQMQLRHPEALEFASGPPE